MDVFYEASTDGRILNVTPSVERMTKYKREELVGQPMVIFYYDPDIREPLLKKLHKQGYVREYEVSIKDKDGSPVPCSLNSRVICDENGVEY